MNAHNYIQKQIDGIERQIDELNAELKLLGQLLRAMRPESEEISPKALKQKKSRAKFLTYIRVLNILAPSDSQSQIPRTMSSNQLLHVLRYRFDQGANVKTLRSHLHRLKNEGRLNFDRSKNEWSVPTKMKALT